MRQHVVNALTDVIRSHTFMDRVLLWDNVPSQYSTNAVYLKDTREKYEKKNSVYQATLRIELVAIVVEEKNASAADLGNLALRELIEAVTNLRVSGVIFNLVDSFKYIDTKGVTACEVELNIDVKYQF